MSFGKLKSARKARDLHSFVKRDAPTSHPTLSQSANQTPYESNGPSAANHVDVNTTIPHDVPRSSAVEEPVNKKPRLDAVPGESGTDGQQPVQDEEKPGTTLAQAQSSANPPAPTKEKARPVMLHGCHRSLPSSLEILEADRHGRGIFAKSALQAGAVIMSITPHVSVISTQYLDQYCSTCAAPAPESGLKRCPKCKTVYYCNQECQNKDWTWHKNECHALRKWAESAPSEEVSIPGDAVRCLGRILWGTQKEGSDSNWVKEIRMMQSNRSSIQPTSFESHTHLAHSVVRYLGASSPSDLMPYGLASAGDLVDLISRFTTNTFTLTSVSLTPIGICIAPTIAFANHSCEPNAVIVFPRAPNTPRSKEPFMNLIALRDIAPGKEVRIAYVDTTLPKRFRQKELKMTYNFTCQCKLCARVVPVDPREALWCPKNCGGMCPLPTEEDSLSRCVKCKAVVANVDAVLDAVRVGQEALDKATSLQFRDPAKAQQYTTNLIPILTTAGLTPSSHPLLPLTHLHQELLIAALPSSMSQETLDEAVRTAAKYSAGLQALLPKGHPVRAVALGELGKLLAVDEPSPPSDQAHASKFPPSGPPRLKLAYESLVRAYDELLIGFGKANQGGHVGRDVRDAIVRLEKELGVWTTGIKNTLEDTLQAQRAK